jgi:DNA helicase-2/ATP-dependent DNA helicase PcrA
MHDILTENWIKVGYAGKTHEQKAFQQADGMLTAFAAATLANKPDTLAIEMPFQFWLDRLKVGGRIDRVDRLPDGRIEIIDYKTGSNVPDAKKIKDDFQLSFYALAATEIKDGILTNVDPDQIVLSLYYIEQDKKISTVRTKDDLKFAKEKILMKVDEITKSEFLCNGNMFCKSCEYKLVCQTIAN